MLFACFRLDCDGHVGQLEAIHHAQEAIMTRLNRLDIQLTRFNVLLNRVITTEGVIMSELSDALASTLAAVEAVDTNVARELQDFADRVGGKLSDEDRAQFAAIAQKLVDINTSVDTADPATPPADGTQPTA